MSAMVSTLSNWQNQMYSQNTTYTEIMCHPGTVAYLNANMTGRWMDDLRFYVLSTIFQSYQDDGPVIMKGNGTPFTVKKISPRARLEVQLFKSSDVVS